MVKSLASQKNDYTVLRIRKSFFGFHIQGKGVSVNRPYGVSADIKLENSTSLEDWVNSQDHPKISLAETGKVYVIAQAAIRGKSIHIQINGSDSSKVEGSGSRHYGVAFDVLIADNKALAEFISDKDNINGVDSSTHTEDDYAIIGGVKFNLIKA